MAGASTGDVLKLLTDAGASDDDARKVVGALGRAGLAPPRMRSWLASPDRSYSVGTGMEIAGVEMEQMPIEAVEDGDVAIVLEAAEAFASASADERFISLTCLCDLDAVRRLTHGSPQRTATVKRIAQLLLNTLRKDVHVSEALQTTLPDDPDDTRLVDWMADERLDDALVALDSGSLDPVTLRAQGELHFYGW